MIKVLYSAWENLSSCTISFTQWSCKMILTRFRPPQKMVENTILKENWIASFLYLIPSSELVIVGTYIAIFEKFVKQNEEPDQFDVCVKFRSLHHRIWHISLLPVLICHYVILTAMAPHPRVFPINIFVSNVLSLPRWYRNDINLSVLLDWPIRLIILLLKNRCNCKFYLNGLSRISRLWDSLPVSRFLVKYDLPKYKSNINYVLFFCILFFSSCTFSSLTLFPSL